MANLKEVRGRITSVKSTQQITKAMKMVAAAKLRRAQNRIIDMRPYAQKLNDILQNVSGALADDSLENKYAEVRDVENVLIVVVTSDRGLCGGFNANIAKSTISLIESKYQKQFDKGNVTLLTIGKKGADFFRRRNYKMIDTYRDIQATKFVPFDTVREAAELAMDGFLDGSYDAVDIVYNEFKNVATQIVRQEAFLPVVANEKESTDEKTTAQSDYIFEPSKEEIVQELIPKSLKIQFFKAVLESGASEQGARMTAMDQATENAGELLKELRLSYNRTRQAMITTEILEIVGGAEALAQGS